MPDDPPALMMPALEMPEREAREPVHQWVFRSLRRAIMSGGFPPGQAVTIRGLADRMGVFQGMRAALLHGHVAWGEMLWAIGLNAVWVSAAGLLFASQFHAARVRGALITIGE